jgi:hypothetical protein
MKILVVALLVAIVISLGSGLFFLTRDDTDSPRLLAALKIRVALSVLLIVVLVSSFYFGWITP